MLIIILITLYGNFATGTEYTLEYEWSSNGPLLALNQDESTHPVVLEEDYLHLNILVHNNMSIKNVKCSNYFCGFGILSTKHTNAGQDIFSFTVIYSKPFGTQWRCLFFTKGGNISSTLKFHIRTKLPPTSMFVNDYEMKTKTSPLAVTAYDAVAHYTFAVGETAVIDCSPQARIDGVMTSFYSNNDSSFFIRKKEPTCNRLLGKESDNSSSNTYPLTIKLTNKYDKKFVQCQYDNGVGDVFVTRLIFRLQHPDTPGSIISLKINGMKVNVWPSNHSNFDYSLVYQAGEAIDIDVSIQNAQDSSLLVNYDGKEHFLSQYYKKTLNLKEGNDGEELQILASDSKFTRENLTITFVHHPSHLFLTDINKGRILKQYARAENSVVVHYQYSDYERISIIYSVHMKLHCIGTAKFTANSTIDSRFSELKLLYRRKITATLERQDDGSSIYCTIKRIGQKEIVEGLDIQLIYKPEAIIEDDGTISWIPWTVSLFIILAIIVILAVIMKKKKEKKCSVSNNVNPSIEFANLYPMDGPEELPQAGPKAERPQEPLPHTNQEPYHFHRSESNDPTVYSEVYYEPSFPKRIPPACAPANTENEYAYADCAHLIERHKSPFDAVASRMALEQAKRSNKNDYSNLKEVCKPGHCVLRK